MTTTTDNNTRKRKQEFLEPKPINTSWSDFVYSSPNSPHQQQQQQQQHHQDFNLDTIFQQQPMQQQQSDYDNHRRHSVSVGEMHFHSFDKMGWNNNEIEQLLSNGHNNSLPSSWSSNSSGTVIDNNNTHQPPMIHRRAMSLRLDTLQQPPPQPIDMHRASISTASPTTPAFFSPSFLDALKHDDDHLLEHHSFDSNNNHHFSDDLIHDFMMNQHNNQHQQQSISNTNTTTATITPSVISTGDDVNNLTNWLLNPSTTNNNTGIVNKRKSSSSSLSSLSTSPPPISNTTPSPPSSIPYQQQHPSIPEEDEDVDYEKSRYNPSCINLTNESMMKSYIQKYLATFEDERKIMILTSKVAQKSYGTEKRFLCPPPSTLLSGTASWWTKNNSTNALNPPNLVVHISGEKTSQNGVLEWYNTSTGAMLDNSASIIAVNNGDTNLSGNCVSKHLHINDADEKRKRVEVLVKINLANGIHLGTLASKGIKVISKPSKKRQSVKNMELCIHHGTTISLFNRIRSQTVSTKYLGVSTAGDQKSDGNNSSNAGTCFVARTGSWDPFVIWIVDTTRSPDTPPPLSNRNHHPENPRFPAPPAIALQTTTGQAPIALHYNQAIVLQCVSTGLVSPVMVIRKVDKGSMIMGGNRVDDLSGPTGGECGDEALGDPVSQLHKIAFQIVQDPSIAHNNKANYQPHMMSMNQLNTTEWTLPQTSQAVTYLACLNDVVGMHKTTTERSFVSARPVPHPPVINTPLESSLLSTNSWSDTNHNNFDNYDILSSVVSQQENGKVTRKRRVSCDVNSIKPMSLPKYPMSSTSTNSLAKNNNNRRRVNSLNDGLLLPIKTESGAGRRNSISHHDRRSSVSSSDGGMYQVNGACWTEDVSDASVWTIVGTDCASYKFWTPSQHMTNLNSPFSNNITATANPITPFPVLNTCHQFLQHNKNVHVLNLTGENFTRDVSIWFGDIKTRTEYKSRDSISCHIPDIQELMDSPVTVVDTNNNEQRKTPILFVRGDGVIYNTDMFYTF